MAHSSHPDPADSALPTPLVARASVLQATEAALTSGIRAGLWAGMLPPERELCAQLGVSRSSLRAVLRKLAAAGWLAVEHGRRTRIVPQRQGRRPAAPAPKRSLLLLSGALALDSYPYWLETLRNRLRLHKISFAMEMLPERRAPARGWLENMQRKHEPGAWMLLGCAPSVARLLEGEPALVAGLAPEGVALPGLCLDFQAVCRHAAGELLAKGHRRIGLVLPDPLFPGDQLSLRGFREGVASHRGAEGVLLSYQSPAASVIRSLQREFNRQHPATALVVCRPSALLATVSALASLGKRIPEEVSVICRDDHPTLREALYPTMAHYHADPARFASKALALLRKLQAGEPLRSLTHFLQPQYRPGHSVRRL